MNYFEILAKPCYKFHFRDGLIPEVIEINGVLLNDDGACLICLNDAFMVTSDVFKTPKEAYERCKSFIEENVKIIDGMVAEAEKTIEEAKKTKEGFAELRNKFEV